MKFIRIVMVLAAAGIMGSASALRAKFDRDASGSGEDQGSVGSLGLHGREDGERD